MPVAEDQKPEERVVEDVTNQLGSVALARAEDLTVSRLPDDPDDSSLFGDPPPRDECPVCLVTLPLEDPMTIYMSCCDNTVCKSCIFHHERVNLAAKTTPTCPFCRAKKPNKKEGTRRREAAAKKGTATAVYLIATEYRLGKNGKPVNERRAFELYRRAADLGHAQSCGIVGNAYVRGLLGASIDEEEGFKYLHLAAKKGHVATRHNLGNFEHANGRKDLAVRHWRISAASGFKPSSDMLIKCFQEGTISKSDLEESLRAKHAACEDMWSEEREMFDEVWKPLLDASKN